MSPLHPFAMICQKAENDAYRDADVVVSMLPKVNEHMAAHGLDLRKLAIVPNGISLEEWDVAPADALNVELSAHLDAAAAAGKLVLGYAGSHGLPNALDVLLDAAKLLQEEPEGGAGRQVALVLVGGGHEKARLQARVEAEGLRHVSFFDAIPKAQIPALLSRFDFAYIGWQRTPIYRFGIAPNKLLDYMMAGRPILHSVEAGNDPVAEAGAGITVAPEDARAVVAGLHRLLATPAEERAAMGRRAQAFVREKHSYRALAEKFLAALQAAEAH